MIPRTERQARARRGRRGAANLIVPERAIDAQSLIAFADLVVSAGGTMNREAVALGTPVFTTFTGRMGGVDEALIADGRLRVLDRPRPTAAAQARDAGRRPRIRATRSCSSTRALGVGGLRVVTLARAWVAHAVDGRPPTIDAALRLRRRRRDRLAARALRRAPRLPDRRDRHAQGAGLHDRPMPRLGGLAIFAGVEVAGWIFLPCDGETRSILLGARRDRRGRGDRRRPRAAGAAEAAGQIAAATIPVFGGVRVGDFTLPFVGGFDLGWLVHYPLIGNVLGEIVRCRSWR